MAYIASLRDDYLCRDKEIDVIKRNGYTATPTDFAILLGLDDMNVSYENIGLLRKRTCPWWSSETNGYGLIVGKHGDLKSLSKGKKRYRNFRFFGVRPTIYNFSEFLNIDDDISEIEYGEYPQYAVNEELQKKLEHLYTMDELKLTGKEYTVDSAGPYSSTFAFIPERLDEYEYKGRKFVRVRARKNATLSNGMDVTANSDFPQYVWVEVTPIKWLVDKKEDILLSKHILLSGLRNHKIRHRNIPKWFTGSDYFLDTVFSEEITAKERPKEKINPKEEIDKILSSIREYKRYYENNINIEDEISKVLSDYNKELDKLLNKSSREIDLVVSPDDNTPEKIHQELLNKLHDILEKVKNYSNKVMDYYEMIVILKKSLDIDQNISIKELFDIKNLDELCRDIVLIRKSIAFIRDLGKNLNLNNKLFYIIGTNIERINGYIKEFNPDDNLKAKTLEDLKLEFRKDLHPFLEELSEYVQKQDLVNEILESVKGEIEDTFKKAKNERIEFVKKELAETKKRIIEAGTEEDIETMKELCNIELTLDDDEETIYAKFEALLRTVQSFCLGVEAKKANRDKINSYKYDSDSKGSGK